MKEKLKINVTKPQYVQVSDITYAQVDSWYDHCRRDLKLDLIYPEDMSDKRYPCIVWICGGGWMRIDKSAHLSYLSTLAHQGFVVCSVEYRTSNEGCYPMQIEDVKAAIRYLKAHADRYRIDKEHFGAMGESAGGFLTCMAALVMIKLVMLENILKSQAVFRQHVHGIHLLTLAHLSIKMPKNAQHLWSHFYSDIIL